MQYSTEFITDKILETAVNDTSIYRLQKNGKFMNTNMAEALSLPGIKVVVMLVKVKPQKVKLEVIFNFSLLWEQFLRLTHNLFMLVKLIYWALLSFFFFFPFDEPSSSRLGGLHDLRLTILLLRNGPISRYWDLIY